MSNFLSTIYPNLSYAFCWPSKQNRSSSFSAEELTSLRPQQLFSAKGEMNNINLLFELCSAFLSNEGDNSVVKSIEKLVRDNNQVNTLMLAKSTLLDIRAKSEKDAKYLSGLVSQIFNPLGTLFTMIRMEIRDYKWPSQKWEIFREETQKLQRTYDHFHENFLNELKKFKDCKNPDATEFQVALIIDKIIKSALECAYQILEVEKYYTCAQPTWTSMYFSAVNKNLSKEGLHTD